MTSLSDYLFIEEIAKSSNSSIWKAKHMPTHQYVAVKRYKKEVVSQSIYMQREVALMKRIDHPLITQFFDFMQNESEFFIVMEYLPNSTIRDYVNQKGPMTEGFAKKVFTQIITAIEYLHNELHIAHRDIKAENIVFDGNLNIRLIDFGCSNLFSVENPELHSFCGSLPYLPPEMLKGNGYTKVGDIWSAGVLLYGMLVGRLPFNSNDKQLLIKQVIDGQPLYPQHLSPCVVHLLMRMLDKNPQTRITINQLKEHVWFLKDEYLRIHEIINKCGNINSIDYELDADIVSDMQEKKMDVETLPQMLFLNDVSPESTTYKIMRKAKVQEALRQFMNPRKMLQPAMKSSYYSKQVYSLRGLAKHTTNNRISTKSMPNSIDLFYKCTHTTTPPRNRIMASESANFNMKKARIPLIA